MKLTDHHLGYHTGGQAARVHVVRAKVPGYGRQARKRRELRRTMGLSYTREWARSPFAAGLVALADRVRGAR